MYKDADRQRAAVGDAVKRHRAKGITKVLHEKVLHNDEPVIPKVSQPGYVSGVFKSTTHHPTCRCFVCRPPK
jgi:hypothetical protein